MISKLGSGFRGEEDAVDIPLRNATIAAGRPVETLSPRGRTRIAVMTGHFKNKRTLANIRTHGSHEKNSVIAGS